MKYCSYRLDWGSIKDGVFHRTDLTVDELEAKYEDYKEFYFKEVCNL